MTFILKRFVFLLNAIRCLPHLVLFYTHKNRKLIKADVVRWVEHMNMECGVLYGYLYLLGHYRAFRNVLYHRLGSIHYLLNPLCPRLQSLHLDPKIIIDGGFYVHFGNGTVIGAERIGKNCTVCQQVTIGTLRGNPVLGDNVTVYTGAIVMGKITIGDNAVIGANTTVMKNVAAGSTIMPQQAREMKWRRRTEDTETKKL